MSTPHMSMVPFTASHRGTPADSCLRYDRGFISPAFCSMMSALFICSYSVTLICHVFWMYLDRSTLSFLKWSVLLQARVVQEVFWKVRWACVALCLSWGFSRENLPMVPVGDVSLLTCYLVVFSLDPCGLRNGLALDGWAHFSRVLIFMIHCRAERDPVL